MGSVVADAMRAVKTQVKVPEGNFLVWGGEFENQARAMARLRLIVPVALAIVLGLLYSALGSARSAATILLAAPFALTGGVVAVFVVRAPLSVSSTIGFVALLGQVSLLGLLVVGRIEERRRAGESLEDAVVAGTTDRFRAVLMASLLALLGLLPMAVSRSVGSEIQRPFAVVIVGGMITTLTVVLLVLPMLYAATASPQLRTPEERDEG
jgi:cobalt-zinc-cadmium resistance protein CzcA